MTAAAVAESVSSVGEIVPDGETLWWSEHQPSAGRTRLMCLNEEGIILEATPPQANVRTRVHEYGGAAWWVSDGVCVYSDDSDGYLRKFELREEAGADGEGADADGEVADADGEEADADHSDVEESFETERFDGVENQLDSVDNSDVGESSESWRMIF